VIERRPFGWLPRRVPCIGLGTWKLERAERAAAVAAVRAALDAGLVHVDTAELYGDGRVEEILGEALAGRRDEVFLVSKVMPDHASRRGTLRACEASLKRLRTDRLDCYLLHWPGRQPLADTIAAFEELVESGRILAWGVSNFDEDRILEAVRLAGPARVACNQVLYHLGERGIEHAVLPACERNGIAVVGYTPFDAGGVPEPGTPGASVLGGIAARLGATARQVILAYLTRRPSLFAIPMTSRPEHARENAGAGEVRLEPSDVQEIEAAFPPGAGRRGVATL
jgi:diketogulonate reductase-like aldo/keto reductase